MSESKRVLVRDNEGCCQIVPLNRKKNIFSAKNNESMNNSVSVSKSPEIKAVSNDSSIIDYSIVRAIVREEVRSILREELSKMFENYKK